MSDTQQGYDWWQASDGKWYPPQPAQAPPPQWQQPPQQWPGPPPAQKTSGFLKGCLISLGVLAVLGVVVIVIIIVAAGHVAKKINNTADAGNLGGSAPAAAYTVGQTATTGKFRVTVYAVKDPYTSTNQISTPPAGDHYVEVDVQVTNPGTNQQAFSSVFGFHLLDSANHQYDETVFTGVSPGPPDGQIAGGQSIRGFVVFAVPDGTTGLRLRAQGSLTAAGAVFTL